MYIFCHEICLERQFIIFQRIKINKNDYFRGILWFESNLKVMHEKFDYFVWK